MNNTRQYNINTAIQSTYGISVLFEQTEDGCFPVLVLRGTEYEKGRAYGKLLANRISRQVSRVMTSIYADFGGYIADAGSAPLAVQLERGKGEVMDMIRRDLLPAVERQVSDSLERIRGIYDGTREAGFTLDLDDLLAFNFMPECFDHPKSCSNFAAWGSASADGRLIHAVNQDFYSYGTLHKNIVALVDDDGHNAYMGPAFIGMAYAASFVNEAGISYGELTSSSSVVAWPQIPHYIQAGILAKGATSIDAAVDIVRRTGGTTGWTLFVCEGARAAAIEVAGNDVCVRVPAETNASILCATNHFRGYPGAAGCEGADMVTPQMKLFLQDPDALLRLFGRRELNSLDIDAPEKWLSKLCCARYEACSIALEKAEINGSASVDEAIRMLSEYPLCERDDQTEPAALRSLPFENLYGYVHPLIQQSLRSVYSCAFVPERGEMYLAAGAVPAQSGVFYRLTLKEFMLRNTTRNS